LIALIDARNVVSVTDGARLRSITVVVTLGAAFAMDDACRGNRAINSGKKRWPLLCMDRNMIFDYYYLIKSI
jgi:hypothetical protein